MINALFGEERVKFHSFVLFEANVPGAEVAIVRHRAGNALLPIFGFGAGGGRTSFSLCMFVWAHSIGIVASYPFFLKITSRNGKVQEKRTNHNSGGFSSIRMRHSVGNRQECGIPQVIAF